MKKIISLGGNYFQMTAVKAAKEMGYYVIDVDYLPNNPAHKYADKYVNVSTLDMDAVLKVAKENNIDGIISFASDVSAPTAAYVAEQMGLPTNSFETVKKMTRKDLFHPFLRENGFLVPKTTTIKCKSDIYDFFEMVKGEIILKPVNASGSKGISRITEKNQIEHAYNIACEYDREGVLVAEEFMYRDGYQVAGDAFVVDGKIALFGLANEHFDSECNPLVPIGESFPAALSEEKMKKAKNEIQRALNILDYKNGPVNLDFMFTRTGEIFIIELAPRNGGNLISDTIKYGNGIDLAAYTIKASVGEDVSDLFDKKIDKWVASYIWHATKAGKYINLEISDELKKKILQSTVWVRNGDYIESFKNGGYGLGAAVLEFDTEAQMLEMMDNMNEFYNVKYD